MSRRARTRLVDVARLAGVAPSTASRALSRPELVRPRTRGRVLDAAAQLGYSPDPIARSLITGRTAVIVLVVPDMRFPAIADMCMAAQRTALEHGYDTYIADRGLDTAREEQFVARAQTMADGVIVCMPSHPYPQGPDQLPMVTISHAIPGCSSVEMNHAAMVEGQLRHLAGLGHQKILYMPGRQDLWAVQQRRDHIEHLASEFEFVIGDHHVGNDFDAGAALVDRLDAGITAVMAFNDNYAAGVISRCAELGIRVPDDLSVMGVNDVPIARMISPALTTMRSPYESVARHAVRRLFDHLEDPGLEPVTEIFEPTLVVRASTAPPRA